MIKAMDESVGRIVAALGDAKMLENSIIIFISDNGAPTIGLYENTGSNYPLRGVRFIENSLLISHKRILTEKHTLIGS